MTPTPNPRIPYKGRGPKPHPKSRNTKKHRVYANFLEKFARTFAFFPVTRVGNATGIVHRKTCSDERFLLWVDFFGWLFFIGKGFGRFANGYFGNGYFEFQLEERHTCFRGLAGCLFLSQGSSFFFLPFPSLVAAFWGLFTDSQS